jgi:uncharacterized protein (DUF1800 family)
MKNSLFTGQRAVLLALLISAAGISFAAVERGQGAGPSQWADDLAPITAQDWSYERAAHLLERAGFGGTPEEIQELAALSPQQAVARLVHYESIDNSQLKAFDESGVFEPGVDPFPASRPATTELAKKKGEALGVKVKPNGNRPLQPVVNKFFYWLRASMLETNRVGYWWANRMLATKRPLEERMALFWHGHFANNEEKIRDYRKLLKQLQLFQTSGTGNFRELLIAVAQDPAMLVFLDAGLNVKGAPNENFAREIMELFTMGVGNYSEKDIREAARAFTGWNVRDLQFVVNPDKHDDGEKTVLDKTGKFGGVEVIDIILAQPVTAEFMASKLYRYFVRQEASPALRKKLGALLRDNKYELKPLLETIFLSRDFYSAPSFATRIKSPVELVISTYKKLGLTEVPGVPDFNEVTGALGQYLLRPPTVAGWAYGKSWITPGLLIERGNFAREVLFPDIGFIPPDRVPMGGIGDTVKGVGEKIAQGMDITAATKPEARGGGEKEMMAVSTMMADRDEDFNTRYASYRGWQMATEKVKPIPRQTARLDLTRMVMAQKPQTTADVVDYLAGRFMRVALASEDRERLVQFLNSELGTEQVKEAESYMEEPLRLLLHLMMSLPEYQLG